MKIRFTCTNVYPIETVVLPYSKSAFRLVKHINHNDCVDISEWVGHEREEDFEILLKILSDEPPHTIITYKENITNLKDMLNEYFCMRSENDNNVMPCTRTQHKQTA